jgi:hypothetical protein
MEKQRMQNKQMLITKMIQDIVTCTAASAPENIAYAMDYETDKVLSWVPSRQEFLRQLIVAINQAMPACKKDVSRQALAVFKETILGKLFYYSLQENHKYLVMGALTPPEKKETILKEIEIIESSADRAVLYLDALERGEHRHFINGILGCVYG